MLTRTHIAIVLFAVLVIIGSVEHKITFVIAALLSALIPDADTQFSGVGRKKVMRPLQFFVKHRGFLHSFTFLALVVLVLILFLTQLALGFFIGYGLHLFVDSFTLDGISPFYPLKKKVKGRVRVGGMVETGIFVFFVLADVFLLLWIIISMT